MAREVEFNEVKKQSFYLLSETYGTDVIDKVKDSPRSLYDKKIAKEIEREKLM